jgi:hypothetical protein
MTAVLSLPSPTGGAGVTGFAPVIWIGIGGGVFILLLCVVVVVLLVRFKKKGSVMASDDSPPRDLEFVPETVSGESALVTYSDTVTVEGANDGGRVLFASFQVPDQATFGIYHSLL